MDDAVLRLNELLFPSIAGVVVSSVDVDAETVRVDAHGTAEDAVCPACGVWSSRVHGCYLRFPADVPSAGRRVVLQLRVHRFTCENADCARRTFVEQIPGLTRRYGQRTERLRSALAVVGLALAGRAGARLASVLGMPVSRSTVLRLVDAVPEPGIPAPRVVGVDEYATRKGRRYGTVLVDVDVGQASGSSCTLSEGLCLQRPHIKEPWSLGVDDLLLLAGACHVTESPVLAGRIRRGWLRGRLHHRPLCCARQRDSWSFTEAVYGW